MTHPAFDPDLPFGDDGPGDDPPEPTLADALRSLAPLRPSHDLWPGIAARLDGHGDARDNDATRPDPARHPAGTGPGRVLAFRTSGALSRPAPRRGWLAAAAVALMAVSSGATYLAVRGPALPTVAGPSAAARPALRAAALDAPSRVAQERDAQHAEGVAAPADRTPDAAPDAAARPDRRTGAALRVVRDGARRAEGFVDTAVPGAAEYDHEIAELRGVVADRHSSLDSATVAVLARNLQIIDAAIAASRAALARDPRSPFLGEQLTRALGQKVDLLRTAALLPRT